MKLLLKKISLTLPLLVLATGVFSQTFSVRFGRDESMGFAVNCRASCLYNDTIYTLISENRNNAWFPTIFKVNLSGNVLDTIFLGEGVFSMNGGWADNITVDQNGIIICGSKTPQEGGVRLARINSLNLNGQEIWEKVFGDSIHDYIFTQVKKTIDGGIIAVGSAALTPSFPKFYVVKTDADGNIEWEKFLGVGDKYRNGVWVTELENGGYVVSGFEDRTENNPCGIIYKLSATGNLLHTKKYPFWGLIDSQSASAPIELENGDFIFGTTKHDEQESNSTWREFPQLVRIDGATLDTIWTTRLASSWYSSSTQVSKITPDGNIVAVGTYDWGFIGEPLTFGIISKVDLDGNLIWHRRHYFAQNGDNLLFDLDLLPNGGLLCTGYTFLIENIGDPVTAKEAWLLALDEEGCLVPDCENLIYSITEEEPLAFSVYPNPVAQDLNIALAHNKGNAEVLIQIHDLQGRLITSKNININEGTITYDASFLTPGHYILSLTVDGFTKSMTIVKM